MTNADTKYLCKMISVSSLCLLVGENALEPVTKAVYPPFYLGPGCIDRWRVASYWQMESPGKRETQQTNRRKCDYEKLTK